MTENRADELTRITSSLFTAKAGWDGLCQNIAENYYPLRADFTSDFTLGEDFSGTIMDGFTTNSRETLGNAVDSMLRQGDWFQVGTGDPERDQRAGNAVALKRATQLLRKVWNDPATMTSTACKEADHDWVTFGNPVLSIEEAPGRNHLVLRPWHPKLCAWMVDETGKVDANHRRMRMSARNIKKKFDTGAWSGTLHRDIENCCKTEPMKMFPIVHVLMPIEDIYGDDNKKLKAHRHKFISLYIDETHREILNERGSKVFNYVIPRWRTLSNFPQGFSPAAINSLPDGRMLQSLATILLEQGEKSIDPPMVGASDVFVRDINLYAGGFTSVDLGENQDIRNAMQVIKTGEGIPTGLQMKQDVRQLIAESWLLNKLFLPNVREMRELEVATRNEEFRRAALPFFNPIESQYHSPVLSCMFEMSINMGIIDPRIFPEELHGEEVDFTFTSPLKDAEGQKTVAAFEQSVKIIAATAQMDQQIANIFDIRRAAVDAVRGAGAEPEWIRSDDERKAIDQQDKQVADLQRTSSLLQQGSAAAADVSNASQAVQAAGLGG